MLRFKARRKDPTESPVLTASERRIMSLLGSAMDEVRNRVIRNEGQLLDAVLHGPITRFDSLVPDEPWFDVQQAIQDDLYGELVSGGQRYGALLPTVQKATVRFKFDATRPEAATWAAKEAGLRIIEIVEEQRAVVRDYVSRASMGELAPRDVARGLRDVIGLTSAQAGWVENFRRRQIADLQAAGLPPGQVAQRADKATDRYHKRIHRYRTETIARTEILSASHEGRRQAWNQGIEQGYISPGAFQQWSTNIDGRACPQCISYDGWLTPLNAEFPEGDPPLHPNCRCDVLLVDQPADTSEYANMTDAEIDAAIQALITGQSAERIAVAADGQPPFADEIARGALSFQGMQAGPAWGNTKYAQFQDKWEDTPGGEALRRYSSDNTSRNFEEMNGRLRRGEFDPDNFSDDVHLDIRTMGRILDDAVVPEDVIAVRGLTLYQLPDARQEAFRALQAGDLIHDPGFMSTSLSHVPALGTDIYLRIRVPAGTKGAYLGRLSKYGDSEQELLLQAGTTVRVVKSETIQGRIWVDAEVASQEFGSTQPPAELAKSILSYVSSVAEKSTVEKRGPAPREPKFDEAGNMIQMGRKLNTSAEGIVIVRPASR